MDVDTGADDKAKPVKMPEVAGTVEAQLFTQLMAVLVLLDQKKNAEVPSPTPL